ncbi:iron ABC transporter permease, partial [Streptomyces sp. A7024]
MRTLRARRIGWLLAGTAAVVFAALLSLAVGSRAIAPSAVLDALLHGGSSEAAQIVRSMRLPRTLVGIMVGAALGLAGCVLQGLTRNPIAEPGILGVSQGASVGVVLAIAYADVHSLSGYVWFAFVGAAGASVAAYAIAASGRDGASPVKLALGGAAINALLTAVVAGVLTTKSAALDEFRFWQVGSLQGRDAEIAGQVWPFLVVGVAMVFAVARGLDALALGDDVATGLGQNVPVIRIVGGLGATVLVGAG